MQEYSQIALLAFKKILVHPLPGSWMTKLTRRKAWGPPAFQDKMVLKVLFHAPSSCSRTLFVKQLGLQLAIWLCPWIHVLNVVKLHFTTSLMHADSVSISSALAFRNKGERDIPVMTLGWQTPASFQLIDTRITIFISTNSPLIEKWLLPTTRGCTSNWKLYYVWTKSCFKLTFVHPHVCAIIILKCTLQYTMCSCSFGSVCVRLRSC
jgi:hypothetical protein